MGINSIILMKINITLQSYPKPSVTVIYIVHDDKSPADTKHPLKCYIITVVSLAKLITGMLFSNLYNF